MLIDTHALIWWSEDDPRLGVEARAVFEERGNTVLVSAVSIYEMRLKENRGKLPSARRMLSDLDGYFRDQGISCWPLKRDMLTLLEGCLSITAIRSIGC